MGRYIGWDDIVDRYPASESKGGSTSINSAFISAVENQLDGLFSGFFTVPFSSNNETIKDLAVELCYTRVGNFRFKDAKDRREEIMDRIRNIRDGNESMILSDGTTVRSAIDGTIYSSTKDYTSVFGVSPEEYMEVDSSQVYAEEVDRGNI